VLVRANARMRTANYPRQFGGGISYVLRELWREQRVEDVRYVALGV
jgi:hypothetical protein